MITCWNVNFYNWVGKVQAPPRVLLLWVPLKATRAGMNLVFANQCQFYKAGGLTAENDLLLGRWGSKGNPQAILACLLRISYFHHELHPWMKSSIQFPYSVTHLTERFPMDIRVKHGTRPYSAFLLPLFPPLEKRGNLSATFASQRDEEGWCGEPMETAAHENICISSTPFEGLFRSLLLIFAFPHHSQQD